MDASDVITQQPLRLGGNPALAAMVKALRVGDHLLTRPA
jgi:hypothetical protein